MRELSLFTGGGGSVLAGKLLRWRTIGYVEKEEYCQEIISQRIKDGVYDNAPIFGDIRAFIDNGYAESYTGVVDVITAGFPCQPFSVAGKRKGADDERNKWPETIETIRRIQPQFALLENVPGIISSGYLDQITGDLVEAGYDIRWCVLSASEVGAPHKRERLWILAYSKKHGWDTWRPYNPSQGETGMEFDRSCGKGNVSHPDSEREPQSEGTDKNIRRRAFNLCENVSDTTSSRLERKKPESFTRKHDRLFTECSWWSTEPAVGRVVNGVAGRVHRLKALGNGWVPQVAVTAWNILTEGLL